MIPDNIIIFVILLVLAYALNESFLAEFIIVIFAIMNIDWAAGNVTSIITAQQTWLFGVNALYGLSQLIQWIDDNPKKPSEEYS